MSTELVVLGCAADVEARGYRLAVQRAERVRFDFPGGDYVFRNAQHENQCRRDGGLSDQRLAGETAAADGRPVGCSGHWPTSSHHTSSSAVICRRVRWTCRRPRRRISTTTARP
jgi:hypothetical protein